MRTRYSYAGAPGTCERGRAVRDRLDAMIAEAGGVVAYMRGCVWRGDDTALTAAGGMCYNDAEGHQPKPPAAA